MAKHKVKWTKAMREAASARMRALHAAGKFKGAKRKAARRKQAKIDRANGYTTPHQETLRDHMIADITAILRRMRADDLLREYRSVIARGAGGSRASSLLV